MHFMPDDDENAPEEEFWPDGYKQVFRNDLRELVREQLVAGDGLRHVFEQQYAQKFADFEEFASQITDMVVIGAENGTDDALDGVVLAFLYERPLPEMRRYASYLMPAAFPETLREKLAQAVVADYREDDVYTYAYRVGYYYRYATLDGFLDRIAELAVCGAMNGMDDMLAAIYRAFLTSGPLPPARRRPRRLKSWVVPPGSVKREAPV